MAKPKEELVSEQQLLQRAADSLREQLKYNEDFLGISFWRECGESGIFIHVRKLIPNFPSTFSDFEVEQRIAS